MANLTATAQFFRKAFVVFMILLAIFLSGFLLITVSAPIRDALFPPLQVAIVAFGKLPTTNISEGVSAPAGVNYTVETISGGLPTLPTILNVFAIGTLQPSFGDLAQTESLAANSGFDSQPVNNTGQNVTYVNSSKGTTLTIELASKNFTINSDYFNNQNVLSSHPKSDNDASKVARRFTSGFKIDEVDFPTSNVSTMDLKIDGNKLSDALSVDASNLIQVNFGRADLDKYPVISPNLKNPNLWALVSANGVVAARNSTRNILKYKFSSYPLKGVSKAYEELKAGQGKYNVELKGTNFPIRSINLAYLETGLSQQYLEPVYVFNSDNGLFAYINAIDENWISSTSTPTQTQNTSHF